MYKKDGKVSHENKFNLFICRVLEEKRITKYYRYNLKYELKIIHEIVTKNNIHIVHAHDHFSYLLLQNLNKRLILL